MRYRTIADGKLRVSTICLGCWAMVGDSKGVRGKYQQCVPRNETALMAVFLPGPTQWLNLAFGLYICQFFSGPEPTPKGVHLACTGGWVCFQKVPSHSPGKKSHPWGSKKKKTQDTVVQIGGKTS